MLVALFLAGASVYSQRLQAAGDTLRREAKEQFDTGILSMSWPSWSGHGGPEVIRVRLKDGREVRGTLLGLTQRRLILWTGDVGFTEPVLDTTLHVIDHTDVDTLFVPGTERATGIAAGILAGMMTCGQLSFGTHYDESKGEALMFGPLPFMLAMTIGGSLGALIPVDHEYICTPDSSGGERFESSPLFHCVTGRPGLSPEIRHRIHFQKGEQLYRDGKERVPYMSGIYFLQRLQQWYLTVGVEQAWLTAYGIEGTRLGALLGFEYTFYDIPGGIGGFGAGTQVSGGDEYGAAAVCGLIRLGPFRFSYGLRAMLLPEHLNTTSPYPHGNNRDFSRTTVAHFPTSTGHYLYTDWGFELLLWNAVFGVHFIRQHSPSVTAYTVSRANKPDAPTHEYEKSGIRIGAMALSIRLRI